MGGGLNQHCVSNGVRLKNPDVKINPRIDGEAFHRQRHPPGAEGMPHRRRKMC